MQEFDSSSFFNNSNVFLSSTQVYTKLPPPSLQEPSSCHPSSMRPCWLQTWVIVHWTVDLSGNDRWHWRHRHEPGLNDQWLSIGLRPRGGGGSGCGRTMYSRRVTGWMVLANLVVEVWCILVLSYGIHWSYWRMKRNQILALKRATYTKFGATQ